MPTALFALNTLAPPSFRFALYLLGAGRGHPGRPRDPLVMRILKRHFHARLAPEGAGVAGADLRLPRRARGRAGLPAAAGAAARLIRTGIVFGLANAAVALWALVLFRAELRRLSAHVAACVLTLGLLLARWRAPGA
jgi:spermidine synthase